MDPTISTRLPDVVSITSEPRPTPKPPEVAFSDVLATGASGLVQGAEAAMSLLPGAPLVAAALRGGASATAQPGGLALPIGSTQPTATSVAEGPSAVGSTGSTSSLSSALGGASSSSTDSSGIQASLAQSQQMNLYFLQIQEQVDAQSRTFTTLSNVMKSQSDTVKNAIGNLH